MAKIQIDSTRFHNISVETLADMIGDADRKLKQEAAYVEALKEEVKRRKCEVAHGSRWSVTVTASTTQRLDTKALKELLGDGLAPYYTSTPTSTLRISEVFQAPDVD